MYNKQTSAKIKTQKHSVNCHQQRHKLPQLQEFLELINTRRAPDKCYKLLLWSRVRRGNIEIMTKAIV